MLWTRPSPSLSAARAEKHPRGRSCALVAVLLLAVAVTPPMARWLEAMLVRHVLVQIPLLVGAGALLASLLVPRPRGREAAATIPALLLALFTLSFWMLPRWIDAAVGDPLVDALKMSTLTLLAGLPLGWAWPRLPFLAKAFIWANAVSMLGVMGWLYMSAPNRLCNSYLLNEQDALGAWLMGLAVALALAGAGMAFVGVNRPPRALGSPRLEA